MKYFSFILLLTFACCTQRPGMVSQSEYLKLKDSIAIIKQDQVRTLRSIRTLRDSVEIMQDSIEDLLIRPMMTADQFIQIYKYERLEDYYKRCIKNPSQWKYYNGWSRRVFEQ